MSGDASSVIHPEPPQPNFMARPACNVLGLKCEVVSQSIIRRQLAQTGASWPGPTCHHRVDRGQTLCLRWPLMHSPINDGVPLTPERPTTACGLMAGI
jgi:hypothetical protein